VRTAIDWVRVRREGRFASFPVGFALHPGVEGLGYPCEVHAVHAAPQDGGPNLTCVSRPVFRNFRFRSRAVLPSDSVVTRPQLEHYPSMFPPPGPVARRRSHGSPGSGTRKCGLLEGVSHHLEELIAITRPGKKVT